MRDLVVALEVTERTAYSLLSDLTEAGYLVKEKRGRRNHYHVQSHLRLLGLTQGATVGEVVNLLVCAGRPSQETLAGRS